MEEKILGFRLIKIDVLFFRRPSLESDLLSFAFDLTLLFSSVLWLF